MTQSPFSTDEIYHVYNRGVEKRNIFLNEKDHLRFILNLYEFNNSVPAHNVGYNFERLPIEVRLQYPRKETLVEILAFCMMPNHYHLLVKPAKEAGLTDFMRKLGTGYTNYFNLKYNRVGALFQGKFKSVLLKQEAHFQHLPHYMHLNPLDLYIPQWKEQRVEDPEKAIDILTSYRWSSFRDYIGKENFPTVTERTFLNDCIGGPEDFLTRTKEWISSRDFDLVQNLTLEDLY